MPGKDTAGVNQMVMEVEKDGKTYYVCGVCNSAYEEKEWADKCQEWCDSHNGTCSLEIIQHSVQLDN